MTWEMLQGRRLLLVGTRLGWFWIIAGALAIGLIVILYRHERRLISRRTGLLLLGLRLAAAGVLVVALFEPIAARTVHEVVRGRVLVAVDVSESMQTVDNTRTSKERQQLARLLGLKPGDAVERLSRREIARRLIAPTDSPVGRLASDHTLEVLAFARGISPATLPVLADALARSAKPLDPEALTTDWGPVLTEALKSGDNDAPIAGIVLLTDGRQNGPADLAAAVDRLAARDVPVYPVMIGSTVSPRDAAVAAVNAPESVFRGDVATVAATLKLDGYSGREVAVTLDRPGGSPLRQTVVAPAARGTRPVVTFQVPLDEAGTVPLAVAVGPMSGDSRPDNDRRVVTVLVADDRARVLLVDGEARWEFRYLRNALVRDPRIALETVLFHQPEAVGAIKPTYQSALPDPGDTAERKPDPLGRFDAVIMGDFNPASCGEAGTRRIEAYVAERGGTLVVIAGPRHWSSLAAHNTFSKLLPIVEPQVAPASRAAADSALPAGAVVRPSRERDLAGWPMLQLGRDALDNQTIWDGLPRLPWLLTGRPKPGATVLATIGDDESAVVMAAQAYGLGKVLWIGTDATWRWRHRVGDAHHHRFWGQVVRWAATGRLAAGNALVRFGPDRPRAPEGESVRLRARLSDGVSDTGPDLLVAARVFRVDPRTGQGAGDAVAVVPLRPVPGQPRTFRGDAPALPVGSYRVRLDVPERSTQLQLDPATGANVPEASFEVTARETTERIELAATRDPLEHLARSTGGRVFADYEADQLGPLVRLRTKETSRTEESPLWDQPLALVLFFSLLTAEWVMRKRAGLP